MAYSCFINLNILNTSEVILAHDSFTQYGGAERVIGAIAEIYPTSEIYTLAVDSKIAKHFPGHYFETSLVQFFYQIIPKLQWWFPLAPVALRLLKLEPAKVVISSSSAFMKGLRKPVGSIHIDYCHTPTRFLWSDVVYAAGEVPKIMRGFMRMYLRWLRKWDLTAAKRVDYFIANSKEVQQRIKTYYNRESELIYPFIDVDFWHPSVSRQNYFLMAGRITPYKGYENIIKIFNELQIPLHVVGEGRYASYLRSIAKNNITFLGKVSDTVLRNQYSGAKAFIYPQIEDFGLMPLEAASCGTPTIALAKAGSLETVIPKVTGELIETFDFRTLSNLITNWDQSKYDTNKMREYANNFSKQIFKEKIAKFVEQRLSEKESK